MPNNSYKVASDPPDRFTIAASLARAARPPALEELYFFGVHHGNFALEVGNPDLDSEQAFGLDLSARFRGPRASAEITYFRNDIADFIFRNEMDEEEFLGRAVASGEGARVWFMTLGPQWASEREKHWVWRGGSTG